MSFGWPASQGINEQFSYWALGLAGLLMNFAGSGLSQIHGLFRSILAILKEKKSGSATYQVLEPAELIMACGWEG